MNEIQSKSFGKARVNKKLKRKNHYQIKQNQTKLHCTNLQRRLIVQTGNETVNAIQNIQKGKKRTKNKKRNW